MAKSTAKTLITVLNQCNTLKYDERHDYFKIRQEHGMMHKYLSYLLHSISKSIRREQTLTLFVSAARKIMENGTYGSNK